MWPMCGQIGHINYIYSKSSTFGVCKKNDHGYPFGTFGRDIWSSKNGFASLKLKSLEFLRTLFFFDFSLWQTDTVQNFLQVKMHTFYQNLDIP